MKAFFAKISDKIFTSVAKKQALTGCYWACHNPEIPEELL